MHRVVMAFGKPNRSVRHLLTPGQPVELAIQLNGGSAKVIGLPQDNTTDVAAADPAEQAMEGVIAELSAALYLVDLDFTLHAEIIQEMLTGESERPAEEIDDEIGRAHVRPPVTNAHLVCRLLLEKQQ